MTAVRARRRLQLQEWRCATCRRLLARVNRAAIRDDVVAVEVKCTCGRLNYLEANEARRTAA